MSQIGDLGGLLDAYHFMIRSIPTPTKSVLVGLKKIELTTDYNINFATYGSKIIQIDHPE